MLTTVLDASPRNIYWWWNDCLVIYNQILQKLFRAMKIVVVLVHSSPRLRDDMCANQIHKYKYTTSWLCFFIIPWWDFFYLRPLRTCLLRQTLKAWLSHLIRISRDLHWIITLTLIQIWLIHVFVGFAGFVSPSGHQSAICPRYEQPPRLNNSAELNRNSVNNIC